ncbi:MAG: hypothetical protein ABEL51_10695 [Salinibacter sp.]
MAFFEKAAGCFTDYRASAEAILREIHAVAALGGSDRVLPGVASDSPPNSFYKL